MSVFHHESGPTHTPASFTTHGAIGIVNKAGLLSLKRLTTRAIYRLGRLLAPQAGASPLQPPSEPLQG